MVCFNWLNGQGMIALNHILRGRTALNRYLSDHRSLSAVMIDKRDGPPGKNVQFFSNGTGSIILPPGTVPSGIPANPFIDDFGRACKLDHLPNRDKPIHIPGLPHVPRHPVQQEDSACIRIFAPHEGRDDFFNQVKVLVFKQPACIQHLTDKMQIVGRKCRRRRFLTGKDAQFSPKIKMPACIPVHTACFQKIAERCFTGTGGADK